MMQNRGVFLIILAKILLPYLKTSEEMTFENWIQFKLLLPRFIIFFEISPSIEYNGAGVDVVSPSET